MVYFDVFADDSDDGSFVQAAGSAKSRLLKRRTRTDKVQLHWVSYVDQSQRVLLFTQDTRVQRKALKLTEAELANMEVFLSLSGVGVSVINGLYEEVAFMSVTSSPAMWELQTRKTSKLLNAELASLLEDQWHKGKTDVNIDNSLHVSRL